MVGNVAQVGGSEFHFALDHFFAVEIKLANVVVRINCYDDVRQLADLERFRRKAFLPAPSRPW